MATQTTYDVIIIGGSYAGLSAALTLGRALRRVLIIDSGRPANRYALHAQNFLTRDGETPDHLITLSRADVSRYPSVSFSTGMVVSAVREANLFTVTTADGVSSQARKLLLATGVVDLLPDLPGFSDCWGKSVIHCPYCHGYEVHSQALGILANGEVGYEFALMLRSWSRRLTLFTNGPSTFTDDQRQRLDRLAIDVIDSTIRSLSHQDGMLTDIHLATGQVVVQSALFARVPFQQSNDLAGQLGCELTSTGLIQVTEFGETTTPGVLATGDNSSPMRQVVQAVANGSRTGVMLNRQLSADDLQQEIEQTR